MSAGTTGADGHQLKLYPVVKRKRNENIGN
jgi:hypothetical protein